MRPWSGTQYASQPCASKHSFEGLLCLYCIMQLSWQQASWVLPGLAGGQTHQIMMQLAHETSPVTAGRAGNPDIKSIDLLES